MSRFRDIRDEETGALVLRYDPTRHRVEVKSEQTRGRVKEYPLPDRADAASVDNQPRRKA